ncbi:MAG: hypothetical protein Q8P89_03440 [bacterium]|nr:hypothetical protein [bacterium]
MSKVLIILKGFLAVVILGMLTNLIVLDWREFKGRPVVQKDQGKPAFARVTPTPFLKLSEAESSPPGEKVIQLEVKDEACSQACLLAIDKALNATPVSTVTPAPGGSTVKIFYLPFGSGSTKSQDWIDIPGLVSYIDPANYGKVKTVIFEASVRIPTANGRIYARLYNKNDGRPVWFSDISSEGLTSTLIQSSPITFDQGNKLYQVQAKTTMGFESFIDFARVKFITE